MLQLHTLTKAAAFNTDTIRSSAWKSARERLSADESAFMTAFRAIVGVDWQPLVHGPQTLRIISHTRIYELILFKQMPILLIERSGSHSFSSYTRPGPGFVPPFKIHPSIWTSRNHFEPDYSI